MLVTCPNCETVFRVDSDSIGEAGKTVRCSVCSHIWHAQPLEHNLESEAFELGLALRMVLLPLVVLVLVVGIVVGGIMQRSTVTAYAPTLIPLFEKAGLMIRPKVENLAIVDLSADYSGDTVRLRGRLYNQAAFFVHAPQLEVTIATVDGAPLVKQVIKPDDQVIGPEGVTAFFAQLVIDEAREPTVTVIMLADRVLK